MNKVNKFYWSEETLTYFKEKFDKAMRPLLWEVTEFVEQSCDLEDGEKVEDLVADLMQQVLTK